MREHWRVGIIERAALEALDELGAQPEQLYVKSARVVRHLEKEHGVSPRYGYESLCAMARPWLIHVCLTDFHGNNGSVWGDDAAPPRYTEMRLSPAGASALAAERRIGPRLPVALINGDLHADGSAPSFSRPRVIAALLALVDNPHLDDEDIVERVGIPESVTGCDVACDYRRLGTGEPTSLVMSARVDREPGGRGQVLVVSHLPVGVGSDAASSSIGARVATHGRSDPDWNPPDLDELALPLRSVTDETAENVRIVCKPRKQADLDLCEAQIRATWGVTVRRAVQLPAPLPDLMRELADQDPAALRTALAALSGT